MILETFEKATEADIAEGINWYPEAFKFASSLLKRKRISIWFIKKIKINFSSNLLFASYSDFTSFYI